MSAQGAEAGVQATPLRRGWTTGACATAATRSALTALLSGSFEDPVVELTTDDQMREWLPKLVGIEQHVRFVLPGGEEVRCTVDPQHAAQLTREHVTAAVHYITFQFTTQQVAAFGEGVRLEIDHPNYLESVALAPFTVAELLTDLREG